MLFKVTLNNNKHREGSCDGKISLKWGMLPRVTSGSLARALKNQELTWKWIQEVFDMWNIASKTPNLHLPPNFLLPCMMICQACSFYVRINQEACVCTCTFGVRMMFRENHAEIRKREKIFLRLGINAHEIGSWYRSTLVFSIFISVRQWCRQEFRKLFGKQALFLKTPETFQSPDFFFHSS